jgi:endonuclease
MFSFNWMVATLRLYDPANDPPPIQSRTATDPLTPATVPPTDEDEQPNATAFAYESDLRNFLSKNLQVLEPGLKLYEEEGITGVEFPAGGRFIDILALDPNGAYVVIGIEGVPWV